MNNLKYRRQFLLAPNPIEHLAQWNIEKIDAYYLYIHPDQQFKISHGYFHLYLIGYFINPHSPNQTSQEILNDLSGIKQIKDFPKALYALVGRYVLMIKTLDDFVFFNDPCGLKTLYYSRHDNLFYAASQPLLLNEALSIKKHKNFDVFFKSSYVKAIGEYTIPSGFTLYENVFHLASNHYLSASNLKQKRYYPFQELKQLNYSIGVELFARHLQKIILTAHKHMDLSFTLTAGWDSRLILSCCKSIKDEVSFYTMKYWDMTDKHDDIKIPKSLSKKLKLKHKVYNCQKEMSEEFAEIYKLNSDMAHVDKWGVIAYGMYNSFPQNKVAVKGNCSEIGRCFYYPGAKMKYDFKIEDFLCCEPGWIELNFIRNRIEEWYNDIKKYRYTYNLYDLFYWEHRMGSWQAQSQLEWDIVQEVFTPFNSRELLDIMLSIDSGKRKNSNPTLYRDAISYLWKDTLKKPINPLPFKDRLPLYKIKLRSYLASFTKKIGIYHTLKTMK